MRKVSRRRLLGSVLLTPLALACNVSPLDAIGGPRPASAPRAGTPSTAIPAPGRPKLLLWHADAVLGERVFARQLGPAFAEGVPNATLLPLAHGDPNDLLRRASQASAGGLGPDVLQVSGEWLPEVRERQLVRPLADALTSAEVTRLLDPSVWAPGLVEAGRWDGQSYGLPAAVWFRQPFYNDELLRNAGLIQAGRTTPPSSWAEYADVSKRVAAPDERWGSLLPSRVGDVELFLHVMQHVHAAGGDLPRPAGGRVQIDTPALRDAMAFLLDLVQTRGTLPLDRPPFRVAESGRAGLWWASSRWLGDEAAVGSSLKVGATLAPRADQVGRRGVLLRSRHWCLGAHGAARDETAALLAWLADDAISHDYCAALSLPPARRANGRQPIYATAAWPAVLDQLGQPDNRPLVTYPAFRPLAGRIAGELHLALTGKKSLDVALVEGEAGAAEILKQAG